MTSKNTWQYLPKHKKEALTFLTPSGMQALIDKKQYGLLAELHGALAACCQDGMTLSDDMKACLMFPYVAFGASAHSSMVQFAKLGDARMESTWVTRAQRDVLQDVDGETAAALIKEGDFDLLKQVASSLKTLKPTHGLTDGQSEFMELAESFSQ